jgi:DNA-binding response OmpR family regulator
MLKVVMVVVAEPTLQQLVQRQLRALSFDVVVASDAETAIRELETRKPHLVCNQFSQQILGLMAGDPLSMRRLRRIY